jgi:1,4-dihydroxy-2-naphthoate octaprenyltransferase
VILLVIVGRMPWPTLIVFLTLPEAAKLIHIFYTSTDVPLMHQAQGRTAKLHGRVGLLLVVGWLVFLVLRGIFG